MTPDTTIRCPVCGRSNIQAQRCTFCGTDLQEMARLDGPRDRQPVTVPQGTPSQTSEPYATTPQAPTARMPCPGTGPTLAPCFAGFWIRTIAYLVDGLILNLLSGILVVVGVLGYSAGTPGADLFDLFVRVLGGNVTILQVLSIVLNVAYFSIFIGRTGQTPGKMMFKLKVIRSDGGHVTYSQALVRTVGYYVNLLTFCLGFLWVAFDRKKQGLHDKIASTYEVRLGLASVKDWGFASGNI